MVNTVNKAAAAASFRRESKAFLPQDHNQRMAEWGTIRGQLRWAAGRRHREGRTGAPRHRRPLQAERQENGGVRATTGGVSVRSKRKQGAGTDMALLS